MKYAVLFFVTMFIHTGLSAQEFSISGSVYDKESGGPLPGASVVVKGTNNGVSTDFDGNYTINNIKIGDVISVSYVGFLSQTITIQSKQPYNFYLELSAESLEQVIVIGYGTQTIKETTGAVGVIDSESIEDLKPQRIEQAIQGQVAGVNVISNSGAPGAGLSINIRGISTNGDNRPLILVDGAVIEDLSVLNPADIESINILKDATAGIYGVRAANGVVIITTKGGRKDTPLKFSLNTYGGVQQTTRKLSVLNATEYALLVNEARTNGGLSPLFTDISSLGQGTNFQDEVFENAPIFNTDFTVSGGGKKSRYSASIASLVQDGIVASDKSNFERLTGRVKYNLDITEDLMFDLSMQHSYTDRSVIAEGGLGSILFNAVNNAPTFSIFDENGEFTLSNGLGAEVVNPLAQIANTFNDTQVNRTTGSFGLNYQFLNNFEIESRFQGNYAEVDGFNFVPLQFYGNGKVFNVVNSVDEETGELVPQNNVTESNSIFKDYTFDAFAKYKNTFDEKHNLSVLFGTSVFQSVGTFYSKTAFGITDNDVRNASISKATGLIRDNLLNRNNKFDSRLLSYFTRVQYDYKGKYIFSGLFRRDGSTAFGPENKFGYFPAASFGWIASEEAFLQENNTLSFLKVRGSYGKLGNDRIPAFRFTSLVDGEGVYVFDDELVFGKVIGALSNPEIKWEEQYTLNAGIDMKLFNNRLSVTADYFNKRTEDLLVSVPVSGILGAAAPGSGAPFINAGTIENKGFEFSLSYQDNLSDDFSYNASFNITTLNNEVIAVNDNTVPIIDGNFGVGQEPISYFEAGYAIGHYKGLQTDGIFQSQAEVDASAQPDASPGDIRFIDANGDGNINPQNDAVSLGDPLPTATMGLNLSLNFKNWDFLTYAFASIGNDIVRNYERVEALTNRTTSFLDRYTVPGSSNDVPRVTTAATQNSLFSDYFVEDGSFVRIQNIQLGYTLSDTTAKNLHIDSFRIYTSVANALTLTKYRGFDPTTSTGGAIGSGIDSGNYPSPRTFLLGLNLKF